MKLDFTQCKTAEDVERVMKPLGETIAAVRAAAERHGFSLETSDEPAARAYRDGRLFAALIRVARTARLHLHCKCHAGTTALFGALYDLDAAEKVAGVSLTALTDDDFVRKPRKRRKARR